VHIGQGALSLRPVHPEVSDQRVFVAEQILQSNVGRLFVLEAVILGDHRPRRQSAPLLAQAGHVATELDLFRE
jgi:hypothetical protein